MFHYENILENSILIYCHNFANKFILAAQKFLSFPNPWSPQRLNSKVLLLDKTEY